MRILHLGSLYAPFSFGGAERVVQVLAELQALRGHSVAAASLTPEFTPHSTLRGVEVMPLNARNPLWIEKSGNYAAPLRALNKICTVFNIAVANDFARIIENFRPDVIHTHSMVELPPMVWAEASRRGIAIVHTLHDYDLLCIRAALFRNGSVCEARHTACKVVSKWKKTFHKQIDTVVGISKNVLDIHEKFELFSHLDASSKRIIWNPVLRSTSAEKMPKSGPLIFGFMGRIVVEKGVDVLLEACRHLPQSGWQMKIAGSAPNGLASWRAKVGDFPIDFVGYQNSQSFLDSIDILIVPSIWAEPFGLSVVEAYAAGVPVIGAKIGAIEDLVGSVLSEWLVKPGDPVALAARMQSVLEEGRSSLPNPKVFKPILDATEPDRIVESYIKVYEETLLSKLSTVRT